jgi:heavy metal efflux system protein
MMNKIIRFSVFNRGLVLFLTALLVIFGIISFQSLPIDAVPDITNNQVQINTSIEGLVPEEIERTITFPVESSMRGIAGVQQVRSLTRFGLSQVTVVFKDEVDIYRARQLVSERLQGVTKNLPPGAESDLGPISSGLGEIYQYILDFEKIEVGQKRLEQLMELKAIQDWFIKPRLLTVEGVAEVNTSGGYEKQYHVQPDPLKMASSRVHFGEILDALEKVNRNVGGGYIEQTSEQFLVQGVGLLKTVHDIKDVPVKTLDNYRVIKIGDIATVALGKELRTGSATHNGNEVVLGTAMMLLGENSRTVAVRVDDKINEIKKFLPKGVTLKTVYDRSDLVNATLGTVEHNILFGSFLVIIILFLLLGNVRAAIITAVTIPLSLLFTFVVMKPLGISGNLMSLGALDFGIIVDGTVIVIDNCVRMIQERIKSTGRKLNAEELKETIYEATVEIRQAAGFGQLIIVMVFIPVFALTGIEGKMFVPMASTFVIAVIGALILSFTTAPALATLILSGDSQGKEPRVMKWFENLYLPFLDKAIKYQKRTMLVGLISVLAGVVLFMTRGAEFLPQLGEGSFAFHMIRPVNMSLTQSLEFQKRADKLLVESFPEVKDVFSRLGTSEVATDPMGPNVSDTYIMLKPREEWESSGLFKKSYPELAQEIVQVLEKHLPGQNYLASQPIQMRFNELLEGTRADVAIKIFGPDLEMNLDLSKKIQAIVSKVEGAGDVELDLAGTSPVLRIEPKDRELATFGASLSDVLETVSVAIGGEERGFIYENDRKSPIVVRLSDEDRSDISTLKSLPVGLAGNATAKLSDLASLNFKETYGVISRENSSRRSAVLVNLRGRDTESFVTEAQAKVEKDLKLPDGYFIEWGGNFKNLNAAKKRLLILAPVALALILSMIFAAFGSVPQTLLIFSCVPLALVGGVLNLMILGLPFSISAGVGFIALSGIAVLNGVVLVNYFNQLRLEGLTGVELVKKATSIRLRPVLMTALVAIFGFIPMMISSGVGAEVQRPLATVVIGGIISSTLLTLIVLPVLYLVFEKHMLKFSQKLKH